MYRHGRLENGIRIVTEHWPCSRSVSLGVLIDVGPQDDPPGLSGLAHLSEHALFQGTSGRSAFEIARLMDVAGGTSRLDSSQIEHRFFSGVGLGEHAVVLGTRQIVMRGAVVPS